MDAHRTIGDQPTHESCFQLTTRWLCLIVACGWCVGCLGCNGRAVVPPTTSIDRTVPSRQPVPIQGPSPQPVILETPTHEHPTQEVPLSESVDQDRMPQLPFAPIGNKNQWQPTVAARNWKHIVLHHTASTAGDVESIHEAHRKNKDKNGNPWLGIGYHFVIGNGHGMADGEIEPTFRWKQQLQGAHAGVSEHNQRGIGICLIGNFSESEPTTAQMASVRRLVRTLAKEYDIPPSEIVGHGDVKATECPGKYFSLKDVRNATAALDDRDLH